jgi:amidohydrolase
MAAGGRATRHPPVRHTGPAQRHHGGALTPHALGPPPCIFDARTGSGSPKRLLPSFQTIISRNKKPLETAVISVTTINAGKAPNVIPDTCEMTGTVRCYTRETLDLIERRMGKIAHGTAAAHGAQCEFEFQRIYPSTVNHAAETAFARKVLTELVGPERLIAQAPIMATEDFAFMLESAPGSYCFIGNGNGDGEHRESGHGHGPCLVHNTSYDFNDDLLPVGASYQAHLTERWLATPRQA